MSTTIPVKSNQITFNTFLTIIVGGLVTYATYMTKHEFERLETQMAIKAEVNLQILDLRERITTLEFRMNSNERNK